MSQSPKEIAERIIAKPYPDTELHGYFHDGLELARAYLELEKEVDVYLKRTDPKDGSLMATLKGLDTEITKLKEEKFQLKKRIAELEIENEGIKEHE